MISICRQIARRYADARSIVAESVTLDIRGLQHHKGIRIIIKASPDVFVDYPTVGWYEQLTRIVQSSNDISRADGREIEQLRSAECASREYDLAQVIRD